MADVIKLWFREFDWYRNTEATINDPAAPKVDRVRAEKMLLRYRKWNSKQMIAWLKQSDMEEILPEEESS